MSKHTPGPWWKDGRIVRPASEAHPRRAAIAACDLSHGLGDAAVEDEANARLIAASPLMLHELYAAAAQIEALGGDASTQRAVIAKATGESA